MSSSVSASVSRCKGLSLAPRAVAFPRARGVIVRAEGEASAAATATAPPVEPEVEKAAEPEPEKAAPPPPKPNRKDSLEYQNEYQTSVFYLLLISFCTVLTGCYFQIQGFKI